MNHVEIYTWSTCPFCRRAEQLLDRKGIAYTKYVLDGDETARDAMVARGTGGRRSVPLYTLHLAPETQKPLSYQT